MTRERILILAPFGRDGLMLQGMLHAVGIAATCCADIAEVLREMAAGAAGLFISEEALLGSSAQELVAVLDEQEAWSDIPLVVLLGKGDQATRAAELVRTLGEQANVTYLDRPVRRNTLMSAATSMLRSRRRQYEARDLIRAHAVAELREHEARAQAEAATAMRDEFLGVASHELRTPLTVVMGYAEGMARSARRGTLDLTALAARLEELLLHAKRLDVLVEDLLDTSRIQQGRILLEPTRVNLIALTTGVIERFRSSPEYIAGHTIEVLASQEIVGVWDESRLDQVLTNLVSNALKYSPDGGRVTVELEERESRVSIRVTDEGLGIAEDRVPDLFQPFSRVHSDRRLVNGTGLGLYIAAQLVERHRGTINVTSRLGEGTTFTVDLPLRAVIEEGDTGEVLPRDDWGLASTDATRASLDAPEPAHARRASRRRNG